MPPRKASPVKAPRSAGCRTCVQRHKKCDLTRPQCMQCENRGGRCPGYDPVKFHDQGPSLRERHQVDLRTCTSKVRISSEGLPLHGRTPGLPPSPNTPSATILATADADFSIDDDRPARADGNREEERPLSFTTSALLALISPTAYQAQLLSQLISSFPPSIRVQLSYSNHSWTTWLQEIAWHPHSSPLLNSAIRAVSLAYVGCNFDDDTALRHSHQKYGLALFQLNAALQDPVQGLSLETLMSTVILSFYEIQHCTEQHSWTRHARGATKLLELRGPEMHRHGLGKSTLAAYRSFIIAEAMHARQACFLDSPSWRRVLREAVEQDPKDPLRDAVESFFGELARQPEYFEAIAMTARTANTATVSWLLKKGQALREELKEAHTGIARALQSAGLEPFETGSPRKDSLFPVIYKYPNTYIGSLYCGYWLVLTMLDQVLMKLEQRLSDSTLREPNPSTGPVVQHTNNDGHGDSISSSQSIEARSTPEVSTRLQEYELECVENARKTCMSAEDLSTNVFLGSVHLTFGLRAALRSVESETMRVWICSQMQRLSRGMNIARFASPQLSVVSRLINVV